MEFSTRPTVLLLDHNSLSRRSLSSHLQKKGCFVIETEQPTGTLQALREREVDVVLMSLTTTKEESTITLLRIKEIRPTSEIILMTSPMEIALSIQCMKLGAFDDLLVPIDLNTLLSRIRAACEKKQEKDRIKTASAEPLGSEQERKEMISGGQDQNRDSHQ
ncbi:MAG: response regulator [Candidatus Latescibacteria bacterium]|nr:response regulator [Candidatus Latescibacterota bacterium]NIO55269.1 response regulator [Candidatus Latescibacterota bacterium]